MRRWLLFLLFLPFLPFVLIIGLPTEVISQQEVTGPNLGTSRRRITVSGVLRDAQTNRVLDGAIVELRSATGGGGDTTLTGVDGSFAFMNLRPGSYVLSVRRLGYEPISQSLHVEGSFAGIEIRLKANVAAPAPTEDVVSVRELSLPKRAREAMDKGLRLLYGEDDYAGSLREFQRAIREFPAYYEAYAQMGAAYMKQGDWARAEETLQKSLEVSGGQYGEAHAILASLFSNTSRFAEAEAAAREATRLDPVSPRAHHELARALYSLGRLGEAEESAIEARRLDPDNPSVHLALANIHARSRNYRALVEDLDAYLRLAPDGEQAEQARRTREQVRRALAAAQGTTDAADTSQ